MWSISSFSMRWSRAAGVAFAMVILFSCNRANKSGIETVEPDTFADAGKPPVTLIIHGGAGVIKRENMSPESEKAYREKLEEALRTGYAVLDKGGSSTDAVIAAINVMEDSPLFNAGKGAVLTHTGEVSMDASIMRGSDLNAGAVAGVQHVKNPIDAARLVMDRSAHVMLSGAGADEFAVLNGLSAEPNDYFITPRRLWQLKKVLGPDSVELSADAAPVIFEGRKFGTVGCVALDRGGNIAAGTSTGGMTNKKFGRIGDSPIIGAGTFADNHTCGVSCTGHGEYFIRLGVARNVADLMAYKGMTLEQAAKEVIEGQLNAMGGTGGLVALDAKGNFVWVFNTPGMFRGVMIEGTEPVVEIYKD